MSQPLTIRVLGVPIAQGSKTVAKGGGKVWLRDANGAKLKPWREAVRAAAQQAMFAKRHDGFDGPVHLEVCFDMPRPKSHYRTGRNAHLLKPGAPIAPGSKPDLDKLVRSICDSLSSAGVWEDDSRVVALCAYKAYAEKGYEPGVYVRVAPWHAGMAAA